MKKVRKIISFLLLLTMITNVFATTAFAEEDNDVLKMCTVKIEPSVNGSVTTEKETYTEGETVQLHIAQNVGFIVQEVHATDSLGNAISIKENNTFVIADNVTISVSFSKQEKETPPVEETPQLPSTETEEVPTQPEVDAKPEIKTEAEQEVITPEVKAEEPEQEIPEQEIPETATFITNADTDAGKTIVTRATARGVGIEYWGKVSYSGTTVGAFTVDGNIAFCMEHQKPTPDTGTSFHDQIYQNENIKKVLYYGWNGAQQWSGFGSYEQGVVITSLALSYYYSGEDTMGMLPHGSSAKRMGLSDFFYYIDAQSNVGKTDISLSKTYSESHITADKKMQQSDNITLNADVSNKIQIPLKSGMQLVNLTTGVTDTGVVPVKGGDTFYIKAPLSMNESWNTGKMAGSIGKFNAVLSVTGSAGLQDLGRGQWATDPNNVVNLTIKWQGYGGDFEINKRAEPRREEEADLIKPLQGAEFTLTHTATGTQVVIETDVDGKATTVDTINYPSGRLFYGDWSVEETKVPEGYIAIDPFTFNIANPGDLKTYTATDKLIRASIKLVKMDKSTGLIVPKAGTEFKIINKDTGLDVTFVDAEGERYTTLKTDEKGECLLPDKLDYGAYQAIETKAPEGYLIDPVPIDFVVDKEYDETAPLMVLNNNDNAMGKITICKTDEDTKRGIIGAEFTIYATKDIVTPDGTIRAKKNDVIEVLKTNVMGNASSKELFLGSYMVKETMQAPGYVLSPKEYPVELTYQGQETSVVVENLDIVNLPTKLIINKTDLDSGEKLQGVLFALWSVTEEPKPNPDISEEDILADDIDPEFGSPKTILETDIDGNITIPNLVPGDYLLQEVEQLPGYVLDETQYQIHVNNQGEISLAGKIEAKEHDATDSLTEKKDTLTLDIKNRQTKIVISKQSVLNEAELPGAHLKLQNATTGSVIEEVIEEWVSGDSPKMIIGLVVGQEYTLTETIAPRGYLIAQAITFKVDATGEIQKIVMKDQYAVGYLRASIPGGMSGGKRVGGILTGDTTNGILYIALTLITSGTLIYLGRKRWKRKHEMEKI